MMDAQTIKEDSAMRIATLIVTLRAPWVHSLKEKRTILRSLTSKLRNRFNVSVAEVDTQDVHQILTIGLACVAADSALADAILDSILSWIDENCEAERIGEVREIL